MKGSISLYKLHIMWGVFMIGIFNSKSKIIKAELDPVLEKLGYPKLKRGDVDKGRIWISEKNTGGLTQKITIQDVYNILNIDLRTNVYAAKMIRVDEKEGILSEYSCVMKSHFRKFGNQMSGSGNHLCNYASLLA